MPAGLWLTPRQWRPNRRRLGRTNRRRHHRAGGTTRLTLSPLVVAHGRAFSAGSMRPVASVYIDQHNWTLLSSQNWLSKLVNQVMPTDYNAMYRSVVKKLQNQTMGR